MKQSHKSLQEVAATAAASVVVTAPTVIQATPAELRAKADEAVTAWKAAKADAESKAVEVGRKRRAADLARPMGAAFDPDIRLGVIAVELAFLAAEDREREAHHAAAIALDATERSAGDPIATACDPARFHEDLEAAARAEDEAREALFVASRRRAETVHRAYTALAELQARRGGADLPGPVVLPGANGANGVAGPQSLLTMLAELVASGPPPAPQKNSDKIRQLKAEDTRLRAAIELARREAAERADFRRAVAEANTRDYEERQKATGARNREADKHNAAVIAERDEMAAAHRARTASGKAVH